MPFISTILDWPPKIEPATDLDRLSVVNVNLIKVLYSEGWSFCKVDIFIFLDLAISISLIELTLSIKEPNKLWIIFLVSKSWLTIEAVPSYSIVIAFIAFSVSWPAKVPNLYERSK